MVVKKVGNSHGLAVEELCPSRRSSASSTIRGTLLPHRHEGRAGLLLAARILRTGCSKGCHSELVGTFMLRYGFRGSLGRSVPLKRLLKLGTKHCESIRNVVEFLHLHQVWINKCVK